MHISCIVHILHEDSKILMFATYRNPFFSTEASDLNLTIIKFEAEVKTALELSLPEMVAMLTAAASVRAPPNT